MCGCVCATKSKTAAAPETVPSEDQVVRVDDMS